MESICYVLSLNNMSWSIYKDFDILHTAQLTGSTRLDNVTIALDHFSDLNIYPGLAPDTVNDGLIWSKMYHIPKKNNDLSLFKLKKVKMRFAGSPDVYIRVYNEKFTGGMVEHTMIGAISDRWFGLPGSLKGYWFQIGIENALSLVDIEFEIIVYQGA